MPFRTLTRFRLGRRRLEYFYQRHWTNCWSGAADRLLGYSHFLGYKYYAQENSNGIKAQSNVLHRSGIQRVIYLFSALLEAPLSDAIFLDGSNYSFRFWRANFQEAEASIRRCFVNIWK